MKKKMLNKVKQRTLNGGIMKRFLHGMLCQRFVVKILKNEILVALFEITRKLL